MMTGGAVDVHAHFVPDFYRAAAESAGHGNPDGMPGFPKWNSGLMLDMMDRNKIARAILSISSPGIHFGDDAAARNLARDVNVEAGRICRTHNGRFGFFASLPLPDIAASLSEIEHAFDQLGASGVVMQSNNRGAYPGDPALDDVLNALNKRRAIVFLHPTSPNCMCGSCGPRALPAPILEFMFETTRAVMSILTSHVLERYPDIRFIVPHGGATIPALADRIAFGSQLVPSLQDKAPADILALLGKFHYDLAGIPIPRQLPALRTLVDDSKLLYGSDWPFTPEPVVAALKTAIEQSLAAEDNLSNAVLRENATKLFS